MMTGGDTMAIKIYTRKIKEWDELPVLVDIATLCCLLHCSDQTLMRHIKAGDFKANKLGRKWLVERDSVREFFDKPYTEVKA